MKNQNDRLAEFQSGKWLHPVSGKPVLSPIAHVVIGDVVPRIRILVEELGVEFQKSVVVCDENTKAVLGDQVAKALSVPMIVMSGRLTPDLHIIGQLQRDIVSYDSVIAVGSGTLNDVCKYASFLSKKPYAVFATAPSMNGYASVAASVIEAGFRTSKRAHHPKAIWMDVQVLMNAPKRLVLSGVGDSICRTTAQVDWLLSHELLGTAYQELPFWLLQPYEERLFSKANLLLKQDPEAMQALASMLVLSGIGMTLCDGSYPASQAEHMIAHTMEMMFGKVNKQTYHGEQIAVTTQTMARIQEASMKLDWSDHLKTVLSYSKRDILTFFSPPVSTHCTYEYERKYERMKMKLADAVKQQNRIVNKLAEVIRSASQLQWLASELGLPSEPKDLGWLEADYVKAVCAAKYSRDRFTFLDLYHADKKSV